MEQLIASYLFQYKTCPLPGLGTLILKQGTAQSDFVGKIIMAPRQEMEFVKNETDPEKLVNYIASSTNKPVSDAKDLLENYCNELNDKLTFNGEAVIELTGTFSKNEYGTVSFEYKPLPTWLYPAVASDKIGTTEKFYTTTTLTPPPIVEKTPVYSQKEDEYDDEEDDDDDEQEKHKVRRRGGKNYWWLWALLLFAAAIAGVIVYFMLRPKLASMFGNISPVI